MNYCSGLLYSFAIVDTVAACSISVSRRRPEPQLSAIVIESKSDSTPVSGAHVFVNRLGGDQQWSVISGLSGRIMLAPADPGPYLVMYSSSLMDSAGVDLIDTLVVPRGRPDTLFRLPLMSRSEILSRVCPGGGHDVAAVVGYVFDSTGRNPLSNAHIRIRWWGARSGLTDNDKDTVSDKFGHYVCCGIPAVPGVVAELSAPGYASAERLVRIESGGLGSFSALLHHGTLTDTSSELPRSVPIVTVDSTTTAGTVRGIVQTAQGTPVAGALVMLDSLRMRSDALGKFQFTSVTPGVHEVEVRRMGYQPDAAILTTQPGDIWQVTLVLGAISLPPVIVTADAMGLDYIGYSKRRSRYKESIFLTSEQIMMYGGAYRMSDLFAQMPGLKSIQGRMGQDKRIIPRTLGYGIAWYLDDSVITDELWRGMTAYDIVEAKVFPKDIAAVEIYLPFQMVPARYRNHWNDRLAWRDTHGAYTVLIWTKKYLKQLGDEERGK